MHFTVDICRIFDELFKVCSSCTKVLISVKNKVYVKFFRFLS